MASWLDEQRARGTLRPYPVPTLARTMGLDLTDRELTGRLALQLRLNRRTVARYAGLGLTSTQADEWACRAGLNPGEVWDHWWTNLRGMALVNAGKETCRAGHRLDRLDAAGRRRCGPCPLAAARRYRERKNLVIAVMIRPVTHRASLALLDGGMEERRKRAQLITYLPSDLSQWVDEQRAGTGLSRSAWACLKLAELRGTATEAEQVAS